MKRALRAVKMGRHQVLQEDLEESVEVVIAGYQRKGAVISQREKINNCLPRNWTCACCSKTNRICTSTQNNNNTSYFWSTWIYNAS